MQVIVRDLLARHALETVGVLRENIRGNKDSNGGGKKFSVQIQVHTKPEIVKRGGNEVKRAAAKVIRTGGLPDLINPLPDFHSIPSSLLWARTCNSLSEPNQNFSEADDTVVQAVQAPPLAPVYLKSKLASTLLVAPNCSCA
jgi:hypothetical protein